MLSDLICAKKTSPVILDYHQLELIQSCGSLVTSENVGGEQLVGSNMTLYNVGGSVAGGVNDTSYNIEEYSWVSK